MSPNSSSPNRAYRHRLHAMQAGKVRGAFGRSEYRAGLRFAEFHLRMFVALYVCVTPLCHLISHVRERIASKQVVRVHAWRVVAAVANQVTVDSAVSQFVRKTMCFNLLTSDVDQAVAPCVRRSGPFPAAVRLTDLRPKAFQQGLRSRTDSARSAAMNCVRMLARGAELFTASWAIHDQFYHWSQA